MYGGQNNDFSAGRAIGAVLPDVAVAGGTLTRTLPSGLTLDDFNSVSIWCVPFKANFGSVVLQAQTAPAATPTPATPTPTPTPVPATPTPSPAFQAPSPSLLTTYSSCRVLSSKYRVHWSLDLSTSTLHLALEGNVDENTWMGFGLTKPTATRVTMQGSDVAIAYWHNNGPQMVDYYLSAYSQCNYDSGANQGVCPDAGQGGNNGDKRLVGGKRVNGVTVVGYTVPLTASDIRDWSIDHTKEVFITWAWGPIISFTSSDVAVIGYHGTTQRASSNFAIRFADLGDRSQCTSDITAATGTTPAASSTRVPPVTLTGSTFDVTLGTNDNYPNPPAWGVSYHINGKETPVLRVVSGTTVTFTVRAGATHPLYITDSIEGAAAGTVYAGSADTHGTESVATTLQWTVPNNVTGTLYYQCWTHRRLGWKIEIVSGGNSGCKLGAPLMPTVLLALSSVLYLVLMYV